MGFPDGESVAKPAPDRLRDPALIRKGVEGAKPLRLGDEGTVEVRKARPEDADEACGIVRRSIAELCRADHQDDDATISAWLANKTPDNFRRWIAQSFVYVTIEHGRIVGVGAMTTTGEITLNYVSPDARFRGVSKALLQCLERNAVGLGLGALTVQSTVTALTFYGSAGFRTAGPPTKGFGVIFGHPMIKQL